MESKQPQTSSPIDNQVLLHKLLSYLVYPTEFMQPKFEVPTGKKLNMYMGVGFWSHTNGLSCGLPVDIIRMILTAFVARHLIKIKNPQQECYLIILLADKMAETAGADKTDLKNKTEEYTEDLCKLLGLLNMSSYTRILRASEEMKTSLYTTAQADLQTKPAMKQLESDIEHYPYIVSQLAMTQYLYEVYNVGVKIGWMYEGKARPDQVGDAIKKKWDEVKFDAWHAQVYPNTVSYLYTKAGLSQKMVGNRADITEVCPYLAFPENNRLLIRSDPTFKMKMYEKITKRWSEVYQVSLELYKEKVVDDVFFPPTCVKENNMKASVLNLLKYWMGLAK